MEKGARGNLAVRLKESGGWWLGIASDDGPTLCRERRRVKRRKRKKEQYSSMSDRLCWRARWW